MLIPLTSGAYQSQSVIANAQRCVNLYPEENPQSTRPEVPVTHYPKPGLRGLGAPPTQGRGRGLYRSSNGDLYGVVEGRVYYIDPNWTFNLVGTIAPAYTPISMSDNGISAGQSIILVDGTTTGYVINMASRQMTTLVDTTGLFVGADRVDFADTFFTFNQPGTNNWYISLSESTSFNALDIASKGTWADPIVSQIVVQRIVWLIGALSAEPWFNAGDTIFPFEETPGQFVPHGCAAKYSVAATDVSAFWLSQDKDGRAIVLRTIGYEAKRISNHALEAHFQTFSQINDAIGYTQQIAGHTFYVLNFVSADETWAYDLATDQWHQRTFTDTQGVEHRDRVSFHAAVDRSGGYQPTNVGMDWQTGQIYAVDPEVYTDAGAPIVCIRSFPHVLNEMKRVSHWAFVADVECGTEPNTTTGNTTVSPWSGGWSPGYGPQTVYEPPMIGLRYSDDRGKSYSNKIEVPLGSAGEYNESPYFTRLGMARDRVYELSWSAPMKTALNGAYIEVEAHET